jgi:hypothetical protein
MRSAGDAIASSGTAFTAGLFCGGFMRAPMDEGATTERRLSPASIGKHGPNP